MSENNNIMQNIILEKREKLNVTGVNEILTFDEEEIILDTQLGILQIRGEDLKVENLSTETGEISAKGKIDEITYEKNVTKRKGNIIGSIFK